MPSKLEPFIKLSLLLAILFFSILMTGCASSEVSRDVASGIDMGKDNTRNMIDGAANSDISATFQNASQTTKGAVIGGTAGALTGALSSGIGVIPGAATGAMLGASYGNYIDSFTTLRDKLENRGVNIIILGDQILIVIPSARLFSPDTPTLMPQAYSTLKLVAQYINQFTKMLVKVSAYTDDSGSKSVDFALSQQQAERASRILLASGVDARVLYAAGYGGTHLVQQNNLDWDSDNYRIEITLEKLYV